MAHRHDSCKTHKPSFAICTEGRLTAQCEDDNCSNEYCVDLGHCGCLCHSGKVCNCGYSWPKVPKKEE